MRPAYDQGTRVSWRGNPLETSVPHLSLVAGERRIDRSMSDSDDTYQGGPINTTISRRGRGCPMRFSSARAVFAFSTMKRFSLQAVSRVCKGRYCSPRGVAERCRKEIKRPRTHSRTESLSRSMSQCNQGQANQGIGVIAPHVFKQ